jgi:hypothetical protein
MVPLVMVAQAVVRVILELQVTQETPGTMVLLVMVVQAVVRVILGL